MDYIQIDRNTDLSKLKYFTKVQFNCENCGKLYTLTFAKNRPVTFFCRGCNLKKTNLEKYGVDSYAKTEKFKNDLREHCMEKFGVDNYSKTKEFKKLLVENNRKNFGVDYLLQKPEFQEKSKKTIQEKYGVDCYFSFKGFDEQRKQTLSEKYGKDSYAKTKNFREQYRQTCLEKYGVEHYSQSTDFAQNKKTIIYENNIKFESTWELEFFNICKSLDLFIKRCDLSFEYEHDNKIHRYFPDFKVNDKIIEIKGPHFFKQDGTMQCPFDHSLDSLYEAKHQCMIKNNVIIIRERPTVEIIKVLLI